MIAFSPTPFDAEKGAIHIMELSNGRVSTLPGSTGLWAANWSPDGNWLLAGSAVGWKPMLYDFRNHTQHQLTNKHLGYCSWSSDSQALFCSDENWICRVHILDGREDRLASLKGIPLTGWGWIGGGPNDSVITARDAATQQIYALDWELP
jgi:WD40 repeat protein